MVSQAPCCEELIRDDYETDEANRDEIQSCSSAKGGGKEIGVPERRGKVRVLDIGTAALEHC